MGGLIRGFGADPLAAAGDWESGGKNPSAGGKAGLRPHRLKILYFSRKNSLILGQF